eukprot:gene3374-16255_t
MTKTFLLSACAAAACIVASAAPSTFVTYMNKYPTSYVAAPEHLAGTHGKQNITQCINICTARHQLRLDQRGSGLDREDGEGCVGFTACSKFDAVDGCYLYRDIGIPLPPTPLSYSPVCDWHEAPWGPNPSNKTLCRGSACVMVPIEKVNTFYVGSYNTIPVPASAEVSAETCDAACIASSECVQMTYTVRSKAQCILYSTITTTRSSVLGTTAAVKCAPGTGEAKDCADFSPSPPPAPHPAPAPYPPLPPPPPPPPPTSVEIDWSNATARGVRAIPTYLDQVNPGTMARSSTIHDQVFQRIADLNADHIRYLHWDPFALSYPLPGPPINGKTTWDFRGIDPYVEDFMAHSVGHDSVINFAPMYKWGTNERGFVDPTGVAAGEYFSRIVSWYTQGGFVDELGVRHVSNHSYDWKYWEVLNEVDAGSSGTRCQSLNQTRAAALECVQKYTDIYDGIVTVMKRDHPQLEFTGLVLAWPGCTNAEEWFRYFLNASNHRSPVKENFGSYVSEISYHWYSENGYGVPSDCTESWHCLGKNPADAFLQSSQFVNGAARIQAIVRELAPSVRVFVDEIGVLANDPIVAPGRIDPFGLDRWWWNIEAAQYAYVYSELAELGVHAMAASQLTGYLGNAASISMLDWDTGLGNAWYWVLKLFIDTLGSNCKDVVGTTVNGKPSSDAIRPLFPNEWVCIHTASAKPLADAHVDPIYAKAMVVHNYSAGTGGSGCPSGDGAGDASSTSSSSSSAAAGQRVVILANTKNSTANVTIPGAYGGTVRAVDATAGYEAIPYSNQRIANRAGTVQLGGFGAAIICMP